MWKKYGLHSPATVSQCLAKKQHVDNDLKVRKTSGYNLLKRCLEPQTLLVEIYLLIDKRTGVL